MLNAVPGSHPKATEGRVCNIGVLVGSIVAGGII